MKNSGIVAQLVRASPCHGEGRGFESRRFRHRKTPRQSRSFSMFKRSAPTAAKHKAAEGETVVTIAVV